VNENSGGAKSAEGNNHKLLFGAGVLFLVLVAGYWFSTRGSEAIPTPTVKPSATIPVPSGNPNLYSNKVLNFSIEKPLNWQWEENIGNDIVVRFMGPNGVGGYAPTINVAVHYASKNLTATVAEIKQAYAEATELSDYSLLGEVATSVSGTPAIELYQTYARNATKFRNRQIIAIKGGNRFAVNYVAQELMFDQYDAVANASIHGFAFTN
jgi:hypothetical protein